MKPLIVIPARGGSKGVKLKNIFPLMGKPLISYSIEAARRAFGDSQICVSTDSDQIASVAEECGIKVPFRRPAELSSDTAGDYGVMLHALDYYRSRGHSFDTVIKWQPTTPFRRSSDIQSAAKLYSHDIDMLVSVKETKANPYFVLFEEDAHGFLQHSKMIPNLIRRQDAPKVYQYNGALYIINAESLARCNSYDQFTKIKKFVMEEIYSVDIDTELDFLFSEFLLKSNAVTIS